MDCIFSERITSFGVVYISLFGQMTGDPMSRFKFTPFGIFLGTAFDSDGTAGMKATAVRGVGGAGNITFEDDALARFLDLRVGYGDSRQEGFGIGVERLAIKVIARRQFHDFAEIHNRHAIGDVADHGR